MDDVHCLRIDLMIVLMVSWWIHPWYNAAIICCRGGFLRYAPISPIHVKLGQNLDCNRLGSYIDIRVLLMSRLLTLPVGNDHEAMLLGRPKFLMISEYRNPLSRPSFLGSGGGRSADNIPMALSCAKVYSRGITTFKTQSKVIYTVNFM